MKKKTAIMLAAVALAVIVAAGAGIGRAYAYFTSYVQAKGTRQIELGDSTSMEESYDRWIKNITIKNDAGSKDAVYVRAKAFAGSQYSLVYTGDDWSKDEDGYWVYNGVVLPGKAAGGLIVEIFDAATGEHPQLDDGSDMNVVIIYETTPAVENGTDKDGNVIYEKPDWSRGITTSQEMDQGGESAAETSDEDAQGGEQS